MQPGLDATIPQYHNTPSAMASSAVKCPECDSENIEIHSFINVCADCGTVVSDIPESGSVTSRQGNNFSSDNNNGTSVNVTHVSVKNEHVKNFCRDYTSALNPRLTPPVKHGLDMIHSVCRNLNLPKSVCQMSKDLFADIAMSKPFKQDSSNVKLCLALSCLYLVSNRENNPITLTELWSSTDCAFNHFGALFLRLEKLYPEIYPNKRKNIESLVPFYLFKMRLSDKEKPIIADFATNLVWMWRQALLVQGYNPVNVIYSALFFAWKAASLDRSKVSCTEFCNQVGIEFKLAIRERVKFYSKILQDFYRCNPLHANEETISPCMIASKLKDILQMKRIILWNYERSQLNFHVQQSHRRMLAEVVTDDLPLREAVTKRARSTSQGGDEEEDDDFSDSEIDTYIRSEKEVCAIATLQTLPTGDKYGDS